ncbi:hypothetical protein [Niabella sp.]|uniref:hypothetical protein n=1 Tax=Niabella sp. TaxID=1962976 RepID=UPI00262C1E04|nr:hypothetical protein [Niabella sp.]
MEYEAEVYLAANHISRSGWPLVKRVAAVFMLLFALSRAGNAQVSKNELPNVVVTSNCTKRIGKVVPNTDPFIVPMPKLAPVPAQCLEGIVGGVIITQPKGRAKRQLKRLQKQERRKQKASARLTGEVAVVAGMVQTD